MRLINIEVKTTVKLVLSITRESRMPILVPIVLLGIAGISGGTGLSTAAKEQWDLVDRTISEIGVVIRQSPFADIESFKDWYNDADALDIVL
jgi:hypothetical protein